MRRQSRFKQAMTAYNRTAGQLKRYYKVDPAKYIEGKTTTAGVERALKELRREAERQQVEKAVKEYEVKRFRQKRAKIIESQKPKFYFNEEKQAAYEQKLAEYNIAKGTFVQRYQEYGMTEAKYDKFVAFIGALSEEYKTNEAFGSKNIIEAWRTAQNLKLSDEDFFRVMQKTMEETDGKGLNQENRLHALYEYMREAAR